MELLVVANERTIDGTDDDLNDCSNGGASHYRKSQLHGRAQGLAHIRGIKQWFMQLHDEGSLENVAMILWALM